MLATKLAVAFGGADAPLLRALPSIFFCCKRYGFSFYPINTVSNYPLLEVYNNMKYKIHFVCLITNDFEIISYYIY